MNELINTTEQTPIEIALGIDENGMTTARKLYAFLELRPDNFSRWCKVNITENQFAEENTDYLRLVIEDETPTGGKIRREDYKLTANFAKKLSMTSKTSKGEAARNYFIKTEKALKNVVANQQLTELDQLKIQAFNLAATNTVLTKRIENLEERQNILEQSAVSGFSDRERAAMIQCFSVLAEIFSKGENQSNGIYKDMPLTEKQQESINSEIRLSISRQLMRLRPEYRGGTSAKTRIRADIKRTIKNKIGNWSKDATQSQYQDIMRTIQQYEMSEEFIDEVHRFACHSW
nr:antA/AntB antirepressor family protein [uncultured Marvinbryantia sp.]